MNYILKNENAIYYEAKFSCDNAIFLNLGSEKFFITDARYTIEAKEYSKNCEVIESNDLISCASSILKKNNIKSLILDPIDFTILEYRKLLENLDINIEEKINFSKEKRVIKTDYELKLLKKASQLGRDGFNSFAKYIAKNGINKSEQALSFECYKAMSKKAKYDTSFDAIVAINENAAKPHALPTKKSLKKNDILLVDAGIKFRRYCSDRTCTSNMNSSNFSFKREQKFKNSKYQKIYDIVLSAQEKAIKETKSGMKAFEVDKIARDYISQAGYGKYFVHSTGHGVGLDIHEFPNINSRNEQIIEENMVFTIEPGIYLPNEFGVRIEDTVCIQNGKAKIL
ncbi:Aminopeptidase [Aliarcobacter thereius]|uniref:Aminopeptidase n=1 Tax=Aliarcobacter thereius TaxID=544718 RepID=A0A1C0B945_9BACT|nr:M24 family metallopeptidase [Aliarcobacter thereius]OCL88757.1 Aminopeptidase [Aliarcobacter thereius]OCL92252.1 Aminopeptidase [Aliarcobacter thereius]OCM00098.1 Aminopeptidase [Aliarcobacter thereius]TLS72310.1 aminopeptidase P family protein [Aliarcobacter thereius]TLT08047.1 aminopeptidase P family protein [Aliarcobacter thereius]